MGESLATRLESTGRRPTVTALPDGSVDHFYEAFDGDRRIRERDGFARAVVSGHSPAFHVRRTAVEPGGHAVNMAEQADLLGGDVTLVGHLDDPVFDDLPFERISMGDPADVAVYGFDDGDLLMAEPAPGVADWTFADFEAAVGDSVGRLATADVVFWTNWTSFESTPTALDQLADAGFDGNYFLFDPGSLSARSAEQVRSLVDALARLSASYDVVLAVNGGEARALDAGLAGGDVEPGSGGESDRGLESIAARLREDAGLDGAVVHEDDAAVAATPSGTARAPNFEVEPVRHTGGGDRFDAGLAHALARGWDWADALELGNACAARYIATGESATAAELAAFLRERQ